MIRNIIIDVTSIYKDKLIKQKKAIIHQTQWLRTPVLIFLSLPGMILLRASLQDIWGSLWKNTAWSICIPTVSIILKTLESVWTTEHTVRCKPITNGINQKLLKLLINNDYFVLTTNIYHTFQCAGFHKENLCYIQIDFGLFQYSVPFNTAIYDNYKALWYMIEQQNNIKVPAKLILHWPIIRVWNGFQFVFGQHFPMK